MTPQKTLLLAAASLVLGLGNVTSVYAEDPMTGEDGVNQLHHKNFLGQRPYAKAPAPKPDQVWEGAGLVTDQPDKRFDKHQQMRLHFIGKRPYIEPNKE